MQNGKHCDYDKVQAVQLALEIGQVKACAELNFAENAIYSRTHAYRHWKL